MDVNSITIILLEGETEFQGEKEWEGMLKAFYLSCPSRSCRRSPGPESDEDTPFMSTFFFFFFCDMGLRPGQLAKILHG